MKKTMLRLYLPVSLSKEQCFNIELAKPLSADDLRELKRILADGTDEYSIREKSQFPDENKVVEIGPRLHFATPFHSNVSQICRDCGLTGIERIERSIRTINGEPLPSAYRMTQMEYDQPPKTFTNTIVPEAVYEVDMMSKGSDALSEIPGISMDPWDRVLYHHYFVKQEGRNPTIVEIMDLNNANSEHSRHGFFRGQQVINGVPQSETLWDLVMSTLDANPEGSLIAFSDNSSVIRGGTVVTIIPTEPGQPSKFARAMATYHPLLTAETHNFPTGVAPFPGAETGTGGRIRDVIATGCGGYVVAGTTGYCVGNLQIPGYNLPWEQDEPRPDNLATPLDIEIQASNGASDYGNKFGEPVIQGFTRSFDLRLASGERWAYLKPIMFTAGIGQIDERLLHKAEAKKGMLIVMVGGPAYRVGFGGGAASSMMQGENDADLDFNAVQRGDAEMEQKMYRVIRACNEMGDKTLIDVIHDQGAGGIANVLKELVEKSGGEINIRLVKTGDPTMSVLEIYVAEYQERVGLLIKPENIEAFVAICEREKVNCEILGSVTDDNYFVVHDPVNKTTPVKFNLATLLGGIPQKTYSDERIKKVLPPLQLKKDLSVEEALYDVLRLVSVGSKRFLTNKVDRAVTGLIAQQQCCGPLQLPVSNVAVVAQSHFGLTGTASAIGEQSIKMLVNPAAGARMAVGEALTNLVWAVIEGSPKCSANWMWAPKLPGEGAAMWDAAKAMREVMIEVGMAVDGGKDSLSMATMVGEEIVKSPRELVISAYAYVPDITAVITPDIKLSAEGSALIFVDLAAGKTRLGGSALAQTVKQIGNVSPDVEDARLLADVFKAIQELIGKKMITAGHDVSDGGLITAALEMAFAGNCGLELDFNQPGGNTTTALERLFAEELGLLLECKQDQVLAVCEILATHDVFGFQVIGKTTQQKWINVVWNGVEVLNKDMRVLRRWWEETSYQLERLQANPACVDAEKANSFDRKGPNYFVPFKLKLPERNLVVRKNRPKVAILRAEGSNGDREMTSAFYLAGFEPWDIMMSDLLSGRVKLEMFRGLAAVGGFSYADYPSSAKGWAAVILENPKLRQQFRGFYNDPDNFSLGVCNGCQLFSLLGWVPNLGIDPEDQPRFVRNKSGRFESRWSTVKVMMSPALMLRGMAGLRFGIHVAHGEGQFYCPDVSLYNQMNENQQFPLVFCDDHGNPTEDYPFNPNGSKHGITAICSADGRHLALMPHPERVFLPWQAHYLPPEYKGEQFSPWMQMFVNAYDWCKTYK